MEERAKAMEGKRVANSSVEAAKAEYKREVEVLTNDVFRRLYRLFEMAGYRDVPYYLSDAESEELCKKLETETKKVCLAFRTHKEGKATISLSSEDSLSGVDS